MPNPPNFATRVRRNIARKRGFDVSKRGRLKPAALPHTEMQANKTLAMKHLEIIFGAPIEVLLGGEGKERDIGDKLGISESTVSKWRLRLGLRGRQDGPTRI